MNEERIEEICEQLMQLAALGPGTANAYALDKARGILAQFRASPSIDVRGKAADSLEYFSQWFSARRWQGTDHGRLCKQNVYASITGLQIAVQIWRDGADVR